MELKLNVYGPGGVEKTYEANTFDLMFGTMEDFLEIIDMDKLLSSNKVEAGAALTGLLFDGMNRLKPLYMEIFPGLTEKELRRTRVVDLVAIGKKVVEYSLAEMKQAATGKNA